MAGGLGGLTYWFWSRWLPDDNEGLPNLLGFPGRFADITFNTVLGMILLLTTPIVLRGLMLLHVAVGRALLVDETPVLRQQVSELTESRTAAGVAEAQTLRRLERDLHDGPQQRLVRLGMDISAAQRRLADDPERARILLDEAWQQSQDALAEIRTLSRGIAPPILAEQGLPAAITALAARGSVPISVDVEPLPLSTPPRTPRTSSSPRRWPTWRSTAGFAGVGGGTPGRGAGGGQRDRQRGRRRIAGQRPRSGWPGRSVAWGGRHTGRLVSGRRSDPADCHPASWLTQHMTSWRTCAWWSPTTRCCFGRAWSGC